MISTSQIRDLFPHAAPTVDLDHEARLVVVRFECDWVDLTLHQLKQLAALLGTESLQVAVGGTQCDGDDVNLSIICREVTATIMATVPLPP